MIRSLVIAAGLALSLGVAGAQNLTDAERRAIEATVDEFGAAMQSGDHERVIATMPPRILAHIAESANVDVPTVQRALAAETAKMTEQASIADHSIDNEAMVVVRLADKTPYALVPTETIISVDGRRVSVRSQTLALLDGAQWHLLRVSDPQQAEIVRAVYPAFAEVDFPRSTTQVLD